ncbi:TRAP-type C4-dicarboxylate transport system, large permease component [Brevibacterium siliguriense]|uniref:TRAP-type C4-dicarboxylate transport system, large permease component n=1 Tax=Brevibacterium siliguriense TaxID=1136497 RepID=A0A1H1W3M8_9MICO|nr:TRAP transporter large permease subunit [Brevibacterium siliguriense]SDS91673.1 TRAP-type C4-dicarboxylate transport system, large permease component [Brevibacterium siliguriense]
MIAIAALVAFIVVIIVWNAVVGRNIGEAMTLGFLAICIFAVFVGGTAETSVPAMIRTSITDALTEEIMFAALAFVFVSYALEHTPVLAKLVDLLNSLLGRFRGGHLYTTTVAGAIFGAIAHIGAAITAAVGSITIPWMKKAGVKPEIAATVASGLAGFGVSFPFSGTMFILVGGLVAQGAMESDEIVKPLFFAGLWALAYRLIIAFWIVRKYKIPVVPAAERLPVRTSLTKGWTTVLLAVPIAVPLLISFGPLATVLGEFTGVSSELAPGRELADGTVLDPTPYAMSDVISLLTWIPVLMIVCVLFLGRKSLPKSASGWWKLVQGSAPSFGVIGITIFAAFSASNLLGEMGLATELESLLALLAVPKWLMAIAIGAIIILIAVPLTASATMAAIGPVAVMTMASTGIPVPVAAAAALIFASTEGASPPSGAPIYVAAGIAEVDPGKTFIPLLKYYCVPLLGVGTLIALQILPV